MISAHRTTTLIAVCLAAWICPAVSGSTYIESIDGDLSDVPAAPTALGTLDIGTNALEATSGGGDFDLLTLTVPAGRLLSSITLDSYTGTSQSFAGLQAGVVWTEGLGGAIDPANLLGWTHFGPAQAGSGAAVGDDILDNIGQGFGAAGFTPPLPGGDYTFLLQDTGGAVSYQLTFLVVPEPQSAALMLLGLAGLAARRRRGPTARRPGCTLI